MFPMCLELWFPVGIARWTRRGSLGAPCAASRESSLLFRLERARGFHTQLDEGPETPEKLERPAGFPSSDKTRPDSPVPTLQEQSKVKAATGKETKLNTIPQYGVDLQGIRI